MDIKKNKNELLKVKLGNQKHIEGINIDLGECFMALKFLPNDYIIDGFVFVNNCHIKDVRAFEEDDLTVKVLKLKGIDFNEKTDFELNSYQKFFNSFESELIQISTYDKNITYVGKVIKVNEKSFRFKMLSTKAKWLDDYPFRFEEVRCVFINNDYLYSLSLLLKG